MNIYKTNRGLTGRLSTSETVVWLGNLTQRRDDLQYETRVQLIRAVAKTGDVVGEIIASQNHGSALLYAVKLDEARAWVAMTEA